MPLCLVIPVRSRVFPALFGQKTPKRTGMTRLGSTTTIEAHVQGTGHCYTIRKLRFALRHPGIDCGHMVMFRRFRAYRYDNMSRIDVHLYARKVGLSLLHVDNYCGHTVKVRLFRAYISDNMLGLN